MHYTSNPSYTGPWVEENEVEDVEEEEEEEKE